MALVRNLFTFFTSLSPKQRLGIASVYLAACGGSGYFYEKKHQREVSELKNQIRELNEELNKPYILTYNRKLTVLVDGKAEHQDHEQYKLKLTPKSADLTHEQKLYFAPGLGLLPHSWNIRTTGAEVEVVKGTAEVTYIPSPK